MRASHIEIVLDLNVYTRAHLSLRAKITSNSYFYRYVSRTIYSCLLPQMKRQSSIETYGILRIFRATKYTY